MPPLGRGCSPLKDFRGRRVLAAALGGACLLLAVRGPDPAAAGDGPAELADRLRQGELAAGKQGDYKTALALLPPVVAECERSGDEVSLLRALRALGVTHWGLGRYAEALSLQQRALSLARKLGDPDVEAFTLNNIGLNLYSLGRYVEALAAYTQAIEVSARHGIPRIQATALANVGLLYHYQGRYGEAARSFEEALRIHREIAYQPGIGQALNHLGMTSLAEGRYQRALEYHEQALAVRRQAGDRQGEAQSLHNTANVYRSLGQRDRAIELYAEAQVLAERIGYRNQIGYSHQEIGNLLADSGRHREALRRFEAARALWQEMDRRGAMMETLSKIGRLRLDLNEPDAASQAGNQALAIARDLKDASGEMLALELLGDVDLVRSDPAAALARFDPALEAARRTGAADLEQRVQRDRGRALRAQGRTAEAIEAFGASAAIVNDLRARVGSDPGKVGFMDERQLVFHDLVDALSTAGRHEQAFEVAESARARALADLLGQRQMLGRSEDRQALTRLRNTLDDTRTAFEHAVADAGDASRLELTRKRGAEAVNDALQGLRTRNEELASLVAVESPDLAEIRRLAARLSATFVEYLVTEHRLFVWVVKRSGALHAVQVPVTRSALERRTQDLREAIEGADLTALRHPDRISSRLRGLDGLLVEPVAEWLPRTSEEIVVLVPHGPLALLPFAALLDAGGRPLAERHTLVHAPAISVFRYTSDKSRARADGALSALVVTDPVPPPHSGLPRLAGAANEGRRVRGRLGASRTLVLSGERATEGAVKRASVGRRVLHFATHGLISAERPLDSSLVLGEGDGEDGYLRVDEVFGLDLTADLVVASGCSTGLGRLSGDGILGLTRAFIYAGTPSVLVSQWDVSDRATAYLMDRFYAQLAAGRGKAAALQAAQRATRRLFPHPALWAAFILVGEPR